jgi:hypothetical protein
MKKLASVLLLCTALAGCATRPAAPAQVRLPEAPPAGEPAGMILTRMPEFPPLMDLVSWSRSSLPTFDLDDPASERSVPPISIEPPVDG